MHNWWYLPTVPPATFNGLLPCPVGKYKSNANCLTECSSCDAGKYQDETGQQICKICPSGKYQDFEGRSTCKTVHCGKGTFKNSNFATLEGSQSLAAHCSPCPSGKHTYTLPMQSNCFTKQKIVQNEKFEFENYDKVRERLFPCYDNNHNWNQKMGTLVMCPCNTTGNFLKDAIFENELAQRFTLTVKQVRSIFTKFYVFSSKYDASKNSKHHIKFKYANGTFNAKPYTNEFEVKT